MELPAPPAGMKLPAPPAVELLDVAGLTAGYGRVQVLHGVDMTVAGNEIVALVGSNGAGKSTLLRALCGLVTPASGRISFAGQDITGQRVESVVRRGLAHVPEGRRLFAGLSVRDNLRLGGWASRAADIDWALALFPQLGTRLDQVAGTLSGGEQQMCAIARGLMSRPKLIMIDELSLGLAPLVVDEILARLPDIATSGTALLLVEQDVDAALSVSTRAYVLETGRIILSGASAVLRADPRIQDAYLGDLTRHGDISG
jgi:branched-chain amino acid transport system ATP-binding protein